MASSCGFLYSYQKNLDVSAENCFVLTRCFALNNLWKDFALVKGIRVDPDPDLQNGQSCISIKVAKGFRVLKSNVRKG